jgi:RNA polymerase sigma-54 factor
MDREEGGVESQKSLMEKIRGLIRSEDSSRPLSDQAIARELQKDGIKIARRTVAKYRELLKILPTHLRKKR